MADKEVWRDINIKKEWLRALVITKTMKENMLYWMMIPFAAEFPSMLQNVS